MVLLKRNVSKQVRKNNKQRQNLIRLLLQQPDQVLHCLSRTVGLSENLGSIWCIQLLPLKKQSMLRCFINNASIPRLQNKIKSDFCKFYYYYFLQSCQLLDFNKCTQRTSKILQSCQLLDFNKCTQRTSKILQSCQLLDFNKCTQRTSKILVFHCNNINEPQHDKTNKIAVRPVKIRISLGIRPV